MRELSGLKRSASWFWGIHRQSFIKLWRFGHFTECKLYLLKENTPTRQEKEEAGDITEQFWGRKRKMKSCDETSIFSGSRLVAMGSVWGTGGLRPEKGGIRGWCLCGRPTGESPRGGAKEWVPSQGSARWIGVRWLQLKEQEERNQTVDFKKWPWVLARSRGAQSQDNSGRENEDKKGRDRKVRAENRHRGWSDQVCGQRGRFWGPWDEAGAPEGHAHLRHGTTGRYGGKEVNIC